MAFVDDDDTESILTVMIREEAAVTVFINAQGLIRSDVDACIGGAVLTAHGFQNARIPRTATGVNPAFGPVDNACMWENWPNLATRFHCRPKQKATRWLIQMAKS